MSVRLWQAQCGHGREIKQVRAKISKASRLAQNRHAVIFCCDANYLPFAALAISTLLDSVSEPDFDICIVSLDALELPEQLAVSKVRMCQIDVDTRFDSLPTSHRFSVAAYLRIVLAEAFERDYDRILYMDCDIMVVGERFASVFDLDLGSAPIGAVMDVFKEKRPNQQTHDQRAINMSGPYFNSGVLLIDCQRFLKQQIADKCIHAATQYAKEKIYFDQTLLNLVLQGKWAQLHPAWNWQWEVVRPQFSVYADPQVVHFLSGQKPWSDQNGTIPIKYREKSRRFFQRYYPELDKKVAPAAQRLKKRKVLARLMKHALLASRFVDMFNRHGGDIMRVLPASKD